MDNVFEDDDVSLEDDTTQQDDTLEDEKVLPKNVKKVPTLQNSQYLAMYFEKKIS